MIDLTSGSKRPSQIAGDMQGFHHDTRHSLGLVSPRGRIGPLSAVGVSDEEVPIKIAMGSHLCSRAADTGTVSPVLSCQADEDKCRQHMLTGTENP